MKEIHGLLNHLLTVNEVHAAVVVGEDGLILDSVGSEGADAEIIGAICSNGYLALKSIGQELNYGVVVQSVTRFRSGVIVLSRLPSQLTMAVVASEKANLAEVWDATGQVLSKVAHFLK